MTLIDYLWLAIYVGFLYWLATRGVGIKPMVKTKMKNLWMILRECYIETLYPRFNALTVVVAIVVTTITQQLGTALVILMDANDNLWEAFLIRCALGAGAVILMLLANTLSIRHLNKILDKESDNA